MRPLHWLLVFVVSAAMVVPPMARSRAQAFDVSSMLTPPDEGQPLSYDPTSLSGLQFADPAERINLIELPEPNFNGSATLSYPIEVPPGRQDMQPNLAIAYDSAGRNGWLGLGWDLAASAIAVETRWGVPRYDDSKETESYLLDSVELTPIARVDPLVDRSAEKIFHHRVEGTFQRIIRHGTSPDAYSWEVVAQNGTHFFYGDGDVPGSATLRDGDGNVFRWELRQVVDISGNTINFHYEHAFDAATTHSDAAQGDQLYLSSIDYTGSGSTPGPYTVTFIRQSGRPDVQVDARGGFLAVTAQLLDRIEVAFNGAMVRSYDLNYITGPFSKSLLQSITEYGANGTLFNAHTFEYYNDIDPNNDGAFDGFGGEQDWNTQDDGLEQSEIPDFGPASALSGSTGFSVNGHLYLGFNPTSPDKQGSFGGKVGFTYSDTEGTLALVDINGDLLLDKVFRKDGQLSFRLNTSGAHPDAACAQTFTCFSDDVKQVDTPVDRLSHEYSVSLNGGVEAYVGIQAIANLAGTLTVGDIYFLDVNNDGLVDLINNGTVYFNHLDSGDGTPTFTQDNPATPADAAAIQEQYEDLIAAEMQQFPLQDTLRRWVAPYNGTIRISGDVTLGPDSPDGVRVAIQHNGSQLWFDTLSAGESATPGNVASIPVSAGDRVYFRVGSIFDGQGDEVAWDPLVQYLDGVGNPQSATDVNGLDVFQYQASDDFTLAGRPGIGVVTPLAGTVRIEGNLHKLGATTDEVTLQVVRDPTGSATVLFEQTLGPTATGSIALANDFTVAAEDTLALRVQADSPIDLGQLNWGPDPAAPQPPVLRYVARDDGGPVVDQDGNPIIALPMPYDIDVYPSTLLSSGQPAGSVQQAWTATSGGTLTVTPSIDYFPGFPPQQGPPSGTVSFTVKRRHPDGSPGDLLFKGDVTVPVNPASLPSFAVPGVQTGDQLYFDFSARDPLLGRGLSNPIVRVGTAPTIITVPSALHRVLPATSDILHLKGLFAQPYRGWAYAGYNASQDDGAAANQPIPESDLVFDPSQFNDVDQNYDPATASSYAYTPDPAANRWNGPTPPGAQDAPVGQMFVSAGAIASSRLGSISMPSLETSSGGRAVPRLSFSGQFGFSLGVSIGVDIDASLAGGGSWGILDYIDMNGDAFPDIVAFGRVQYTGPSGDYDGGWDPVDGLGTNVRSGNNTAVSVGIGGTVPLIKANSKGKVNAPQGAQSTSQSSAPDSDTQSQSSKSASTSASDNAPKENKQTGLSVSLGLSGRLNYGTANDPDAFGPISQIAGELVPMTELTDLNGDGLPDRVRMDTDQNLYVAFNLGYGFTDEMQWGEALVDKGSSLSGSIGPLFGFNSGDYEFAGGISLSGEQEVSQATLLDMNGDALPDRVSRDGDGELQVGINSGNGFLPDADWNGALWNDQSVVGDIGGKGVAKSVNVSIGGGVYITIPIGPLCLVGCYLIINPGGDGSFSMARQDAMFADINGDAHVDSLTSNDLLQPNDASMRVATNQTRRTNLLKTVSRPLGGSMTFEYERDGNTFDQPYSLWTLTKVTLNDGVADGGADTQVTEFAYEGNVYSVAERDFLGYSRVTEHLIDPATGNVYRSLIQEFYNRNYYESGLLKREVIQDAAGNLFTESINTYTLRDVESGLESPDLDNVTPANFPLIESTTATLFPQLVRSEQRFYEGTASAGKSTFVTFEYDELGNVSQQFDSGDAGPADDVTVALTYADCPDTYAMNVVDSVVVTDNGGVELRRREATVPCNLGVPSQVREYLADGSAAVTDIEYYANGNVQSTTDPANLHGQRYTVSYEFDPEVQTHLSRITDSYGYSSTETHDLRFGRPLATTDLNNQTTSYTYDEFGRVTSITGPYEQGSGQASVTIEYHHDVTPAWAMARHIDSFRGPGATIDAVLFVDGLEREIQTKQSATVFSGPDSAAQDVMVVSGRLIFDFADRVVEEYHPTTEALGTPGVFRLTPDSVQPTRMAYDILDRVTSSAFPDNTTESWRYAFGSDRLGATQFLLEQTDANGIRHNSYDNVRHQVTSVEEFLRLPDGSEQSIWTSYTYNPVEELLSVTDDQGNVTSVEWDNLGRRTAIDSPDAGRTEMVYDLADNMTAKITANLRAEGEQVIYDYEFIRMTSIIYPNFPGNNVTYSYGAPGAADNRAGRITTETSEAGTEERFYGRQGEVVREVKTVVGHAHAPTYTTEFVFDTWGRLQQLTYPDGEVLTYQYDSGGSVRAATGTKLGHTYSYITRREYDKFGQFAFMETGNGVRTQHSYRPDNLRLQNLQGTGAQGRFQNVNYTYDPVGNVTNVANDVPVPKSSVYGGPTAYTYTYDSLYRLTSASGTYSFPSKKTRRYSMSLTYDTIDNMLRKQQHDEIQQGGGAPNPQHPTTYDNTYAYDGAQPHAPTHIGLQTYTYDANGNQTGWTHDETGQRRTIVWDEENRIQSLFDNGHEKTYAYDANGARVIKRGPQGETAYVNPYFTMRNGEIGTKHVWAGDTRIASKLMKQPSEEDPEPFEQDQYFYQTDTLGSSHFITDRRGQLFQHLEYFAFGETWVQEHSNIQRTPYLFTGQELDEETGLYYHGARYYDPRTSLWQSTDPALSEYLDGLMDGGVYNRANLNPYAYVAQNPVTFIDPDGRGKQKKIRMGNALRAERLLRLQRLAPSARNKRHNIVGRFQIGNGPIIRLKVFSGSNYGSKLVRQRLRGESLNTMPKRAPGVQKTKFRYDRSAWVGLAGKIVGPKAARYRTKGGGVPRHQDTEAKIIEYIVPKLRANPGVRARLIMNGKLAPCHSCSPLLRLLQQEFPLLEITYTYTNPKNPGGDVKLWKPH